MTSAGLATKEDRAPLFSDPVVLPLVPLALALPAEPDADPDELVLFASATERGRGFVELSFVSRYEFDMGMFRHSMMGVMLYFGS